ncbi:PREDICTED: serine protease snake-like [Papilio polytes]|uniref:serine protease snake-like n=1 Tax=Papilio polytes TaxID=76194 RepID=UPI0006769666|nr:PREDICTED: serine protease snake-like [Papilio polytes]
MSKNESLASNDLTEEESFEDRIVFSDEVDDERRDRLRKLQDESRSMTQDDLSRNGYKQGLISFSSTMEEHNYFLKTYHNLSKAKCFQYKNELFRHRYVKEEEGVNYGIVGGVNTTIKEHPYMGALGYEVKEGKLDFFCGCTLISHHFALTAAHCSSKPVPGKLPLRPKIFRFGTTNITKRGQDYKILRVINHPNYKSPSKYYDIALVETKSKIVFNEFVQPACLWRNEDTSSLTHVSVSGWGVTDKYENLRKSDILQTAQVDIVDKRMCKLLIDNKSRLSKTVEDHQICAGKLTGNIDSCKGDSGGPLEGFSDDTTFVFGVTSYGLHCATRNTPSVYTKVSTFVPWIENIVWRYIE